MLSKYYPRMLLKVFKEVNDTITFHKTVEKLKRIDKMFYIHTMEHCLTLKKDILSHATIWMNLEDVK